MKLTIAAIQCSFSADCDHNLKQIASWIKEAAAQGAQVVLPPELFSNLYFCREEHESWFLQAHAVQDDPAIAAIQPLAAELEVVIPVSFFEKSGQSYYNSVAIVDADGACLGIYRKSHIPDGPGYEEKFYFRPGNTGFKAWSTRYGRLGVGICWDQWFPECARAMTLLGAEVLLYPTAIGNEPQDDTLDTCDPWRRVMVGHAVANMIPVVAANRVGTEADQTFYGSSFVVDHFGNELASGDREQEGIICATVDLDASRRARDAFGFFRDRRPELYSSLSQDSPISRGFPLKP